MQNSPTVPPQWRSANHIVRAFCALLLLLLLPASVPAQTTLSIAVVDLEVLFIQSSFGKELQTELKGLEDGTRAQLEAKAKEADEIDRQPVASLSESEIRALQRKREDLEIDARRIRDDAQRRAAAAEQRLRTAFNERMQGVLERLQTERNYDLILNKSGGNVIFAGEAIDITGDLLGELSSGG